MIPDINQWILERENFRNAIMWQNSPNTYAMYYDWPQSQKDDLAAVFEKRMQDKVLVLPDPPENVANPGDDDLPNTAFSSHDAWMIYITHVANSLAVEIKGSVPWSIADWSTADLFYFFDSREFFKWSDTYSGYKLYSIPGEVVPCGGGKSFTILSGNGMIKQTRLETIGALLDWGRKNLRHTWSMQSTLEYEKYFQYRGRAPLSRMFNGTYSEIAEEFCHWCSGCYGVYGFMRNLLRSVNIPVKEKMFCNHHQLYFPTEGLYLLHGDNIYHALARDAGYPAEWLLVNQEKYDMWCTNSPKPEMSEVSEEELDAMTLEEKVKTFKDYAMQYKVWLLAAQYPPVWLMKDRCYDIKMGLEDKDSTVYKHFKGFYPFTELQKIKLWQVLDQKILAYGGCDQLPEWDWLWDSWEEVAQNKMIVILKKLLKWFTQIIPGLTTYKSKTEFLEAINEEDDDEIKFVSSTSESTE